MNVLGPLVGIYFILGTLSWMHCTSHFLSRWEFGDNHSKVALVGYILAGLGCGLLWPLVILYTLLRHK